jgi:choline dehydrogenase
MTSLSNTVNATNERSSVKERLHQVQRDHPRKLTFALGTLATKVLLCQPHGHSQAPRAYGLQVASNASLPVSDQFTGKVELDFTEYYARHEVIISAGLFQSPQLVRYLFLPQTYSTHFDFDCS